MKSLTFKTKRILGLVTLFIVIALFLIQFLDKNDTPEIPIEVNEEALDEVTDAELVKIFAELSENEGSSRVNKEKEKFVKFVSLTTELYKEHNP